MLRARGKGDKERIVPIGRQAVAALRAYLRARAPGAGRRRRSSRSLFVNRRGGGLHAPGALQDRPGPRAPRRPGAQDEPAHAAPHVRHASARGGLRPALAAGDARPRRSGDHPGLHPPVGGAPEGRVLRRASARPRGAGERQAGVRARDRRVRRRCAAGRRRVRRRGHEHAGSRRGGGRRPGAADARRARSGVDLALAGVVPAADPAIHGRLHPLGPGKDSTAVTGS